MKFGFSSRRRLKSQKQFDVVFRTGRRETGELVRLLFLEQPHSETKFGVTVGKKIANAVKRARGRRMLRESFRRLAPWTKEGLWIVASLRDKGLEASSVDVYNDIARSMKKRGLLTENWPGANWNIDKGSIE